jgi:hypothetical protein
VVFVSASNATAASVVWLSSANSAASMKFLADATPTDLNACGLQSAIHISVVSQSICTSDFHCRGNQTFAVEICLLARILLNIANNDLWYSNKCKSYFLMPPMIDLE